MATNKRQIDFVLYQNKNEESKAYGKWYGRILQRQILTDRALAEHIKDHGSPYTVDVIMGVLTELSGCTLEMLAQGMGVQLDGLGIFYPSLRNTKHGAATAADWNPNTHIKGVAIKFRPSSTDIDDLTSKQFRDKCKLRYWGIASGKDPNGNTAYINTPQSETDEEEQGDIVNP